MCLTRLAFHWSPVTPQDTLIVDLEQGDPIAIRNEQHAAVEDNSDHGSDLDDYTVFEAPGRRKVAHPAVLEVVAINDFVDVCKEAEAAEESSCEQASLTDGSTSTSDASEPDCRQSQGPADVQFDQLSLEEEADHSSGDDEGIAMFARPPEDIDVREIGWGYCEMREGMIHKKLGSVRLVSFTGDGYSYVVACLVHKDAAKRVGRRKCGKLVNCKGCVL